MTKLSRFLAAIAALLLLSAFVVPLWRIDLLAPQYPEGLGMRIWIDTITGVGENDLTNINALNHYIGMRPIEAASIPELRYMPWIVAGLAAAGVLVAALGRRRLLHAWVTSLVLAGIAGIYDFWKWSYDYGHNLDWEHAIIKVPGMAYQPPLLGSKQILNFTATSWPDVGGLAIGVAVALAFAAAFVAWRAARPPLAVPHARPMGHVAAAVLALVLAGCAASGPVHIAYDGTESCALCRMPVTDRRYGAQVVTSTGKALNFDSIECLAAYRAQMTDPVQVRGIWVPDFRHPGTLIAADDAAFRVGTRVSSPMGQGIVAFVPGDRIADERLATELGGTPSSWQQVVKGARR